MSMVYHAKTANVSKEIILKHQLIMRQKVHRKFRFILTERKTICSSKFVGDFTDQFWLHHN